MHSKLTKIWRTTLMFAAVLAIGVPAMATVHYACGGPVDGVTVTPGGVVSAASAGGQHWGFFCQLGATTNGVSNDACKGILATLLTAQASEKSVNLWFDDDYDCNWHASNGSWAWLTTVYWGPSINN